MPSRILFLADSGAAVGGGHIMRSLTLGGALAAAGAECLFCAGEAGAPVFDAFAAGAQHRLLPGGDDVAAVVEAAAALAGEWSAEVVVVDHYRLSFEMERQLGAGRKLVVVYDLADRTHSCDLLVDPSLGRSAGDYAALVPEGAQVLAGSRYALVRPQFAALREVSLLRRGPGASVRRALVSMGLTDLDGITGRVLAALGPVLGEVEVEVAVGKAAPSLRSLIDQAWSDRRLHVHVDTPDMARLMNLADVAVGAGGSSVWERAAMGLPSILVVLAENQRDMAMRLADAGAALVLDAADPGFEAQLAQAWTELTGDGARRDAVGRASAALTDGQGAARVTEAVLALKSPSPSMGEGLGWG